jgi:hypothetical protein
LHPYGTPLSQNNNSSGFIKLKRNTLDIFARVMKSHFDILFTFPGQIEHEVLHLTRKGPYNVREMTVTKLKGFLVTKCAGTELGRSAFDWNIEINGKLIPDFSGQQPIGGFGDMPRVVLTYKGMKQAEPTARKGKRRERQEEIVVAADDALKRTKEDTPAYDFIQKVKQMVVTERDFGQDRTTNGFQMRHLFYIMGVIKTKIDLVKPSGLNLVIQTDDTQTLPNTAHANVSLAICGGAGHVSLMCKYDTGRKINLDASGVYMGSERDVLQTYVNYQRYDGTDLVETGGFAGGNCAVFTAIHAIRSILYYDRYSKCPVDFDAMWPRLEKMMRRTGANVDSIMLHMIHRIVSSVGGDATGTIKTILAMGMAPNWFEFIPRLLRPLRNVNYLADIMMLDMFLDSNVGGFENVALLGNVLRLYLKDISERGFLMFQIGAPTNVAGANAVTLAAWIVLGDLKGDDITEDVIEQLDIYLGDAFPAMEMDEYDAKFEGKPRIAAAAVLEHYFQKDKTRMSVQNMARTVLGKTAPSSPSTVEQSTYNVELPIPEGTRRLGGLQTFVNATVPDDLGGRMIRMPKSFWERSLEVSHTVLLVRNIGTNAATMVRLEGPSSEGQVEFSPLVAEQVGTQGQFEVRCYYDLAPAQGVVIERVAGNTSNSVLRDAVEARLDFAPGIVAGELLHLKTGESERVTVRVKAVLVADHEVRFAGIATGELNFTILDQCASCNEHLNAPLYCGNCMEAAYCSVACQERDWKQHQCLYSK